ncbi:hypothetical protein F5Y06DRAFT_274586 [Hypoxylon sp. FL0890]|nr:hypothetical protein F5Y06DRAFT_274586 [Hypoxylon sp. FL0890]
MVSYSFTESISNNVFSSEFGIYNSINEEEHRDFLQFSLLPKELRLHVWRHSLQRHRIIKDMIANRTQHLEGNNKEEPYAIIYHQRPPNAQ